MIFYFALSSGRAPSSSNAPAARPRSGLYVVFDPRLSQASLKKRDQHSGFRFRVRSGDQTLRMGVANRRLEISGVAIKDFVHLITNGAILRSDLTPERAIGTAQHRAALAVPLGLPFVNVFEIVAQTLQWWN